MKLDENILNACKGLVMNCNCKILVIDIMDECRVYLASEVMLQNRECRHNEVRDVQDITQLVKSIGFNFATGMNERVLAERVQSIHKEDFKFGSNEYLWITKVDLNR